VGGFAQRNILITGGASGIGRRMALSMARQGGNVVLWDIHAPNLASVLEELRGITGRPAHGYLCNVADRQAVYATAAQVKQEVGPIHVLVNNAGVVAGKRFLECSDEQIERTMAVNTTAMFWTCRAFLPEMIAENRGHVVTIASAAGIIGVAGLAAYCASKWAAVGFDESLRMELRRLAPGVKTTVVCPYFIDTGMFQGVRSRYSLLLPILKEEVVAERIVRAIARNRPRLILPALPGLVPLLRILPVRMFDAVADLLGINRAMDGFVGRHGESGAIAADEARKNDESPLAKQ
jgi:all-trans-retinol dehydrogenase (NAD+)